MRRSIVEPIERAAARVRTRAVGAHLEHLAKRLGVEEPEPEVLQEAIANLRTQAESLRLSAEEVERVQASITHLAAVLKFSEERWPVRKRELAAMFADDPDRGLRELLADWYEAIGEGRTAAAAQFLELELPAGGELLLDRMSTVSLALDQENWQAAQAILRLGADGMLVDGHTVPAARVRRDLRLVLIRLALLESLFEDAEQDLGVMDADSTPAVVALRNRWRRLQGMSDPDDDLAFLGREAATDLDVATELIAKARADDQREVALNAARVAVDAIPALFDAEEDLASPTRDTPPEIWLAVGERALREEDLALLESSLTRAEEAADPGDYALRAEVEEVRVDGGQMTGMDRTGLLTALISAGSYRVWADNYDRARQHFEQALKLDPDNIDASIRLADCLLVTVGNQPLAQGRHEIQHAIDLIAKARGSGGLDPSLSWGYLDEAVAHRLLARGLGTQTRTHHWLAFLAVCRSLVHEPADPGRWSELATSADGLSLSRVSLACAEHAVEIAGGAMGATNALIMSQTNAGLLHEALELVGEESSPWYDAMRGYIVLRLKDPATAVEILTAATIDPNWSWVTETLVTALLLTGRDDEAKAKAQALLAQSSSRLDERDPLSSAALAALVVGDVAQAETLTHRLQAMDQGRDFLWTVATIRLICGDEPGALAALEERTVNAATIRELDEWSSIVGPQIRHLAEREGARVPSFEGIDRAVEMRRTELERISDPIEQLDEVATIERGFETADLACAMASGLVHLSRHNGRAARKALKSALKQHPDDKELVALHDLASTDAKDGASELSTDLPDDDGPVALDEWVLRAELPASWFEDHSDPQSTHALFIRYLPEMRVRSEVDVPAVAVRADVNLDPDGFRLVVGENVRDEGHLDSAYGYVFEGMLDILPDALRSLAETDPGLGMMRIPISAIESAGAVGALLTMPVSEVIARKIGEVAREQDALSDARGELATS